MKEEFKTSVIEALQYYVYCLVDPRSNKIFYIGKGHDNKIFNHANDALNETLSSLKLDIIREIRRKGLKVSYYITKVSHLPFYRLSRIIKHCNILIDNLLTSRK